MTTEEFWAHVDKAGPVPDYRPELGPCWIWTLGKSKGYGHALVRRHRERMNTLLVHRIAWLLLNGEIPGQIGNGRSGNRAMDHLCRNEACVKVIANEQGPAHLDPCGQSENGKRQVWPDHCPQGHAYVLENTYHYINARGYRTRACRECRAELQRAYRARPDVRDRLRAGDRARWAVGREISRENQRKKRARRRAA